MFFPLSTIKKFHVEIVFVAWLRDLSWETKIVYIFFFQEDTSRKFLILLLSYFPVFWLQISSAFAIIFADCHGLSCVYVRTGSYTGLFQVSLGESASGKYNNKKKDKEKKNRKTKEKNFHITVIFNWMPKVIQDCFTPLCD